jgi:hypothetical protein
MIRVVVLDEDRRLVASLHQQVQDIVATMMSSPQGQALLPIVLNAIVRTFREDAAAAERHLRSRINPARA